MYEYLGEFNAPRVCIEIRAIYNNIGTRASIQQKTDGIDLGVWVCECA